MKTFLFSAYFGDVAKEHRIRYLEHVWAAAEEPTNFVCFNSAGRVHCAFHTVNADECDTLSDEENLAFLKDLINDIDPNGDLCLWQHAKGEYEAAGRRFPGSAKRLARNVFAFVRIVEEHNPDYVFLWNQFNAFHSIVAAFLRKKDVKYGFFHDGVLPGSIAFDPDGEMGESWVSRRPDLFSRVAVSDHEVLRARDYLRLVRSNAQTRHSQRASIDVQEALRHAGFGGRPFILYAGQNDWHAGIKPDTRRRHIHSPHFTGSLEALYDLDKAAGALGAAIVYKPHPLHRERYSYLMSTEFRSSLILHSIDLNAVLARASVVATIASQVSYSALFIGKPVILLGKNQLVSKGLTYEITDPGNLVEDLTRAMEDPLFADREDQIVDHIAKLEKVYLFDFGTFSQPYFRRGPKAAARFMHLCASNSPEEVVDTLTAGRFFEMGMQ
ncbi:hypothetical protein [Ciceribacter sp. L1K22]|uniref:capsular polysaccharide export protein, LipB/KpsS family n=1 Tax=Ciceribacter sp. L1K22 TaxID=2820275 RepID=UPI001ABE3D80|nr:hypothetical protein [Ciceribacter sp. L1K22]MBO3761559.1 hypothetical protein [Ciceribacter sp. L1K22]